jgi:hypothetical protein
LLGEDGDLDAENTEFHDEIVKIPQALELRILLGELYRDKIIPRTCHLSSKFDAVDVHV